MKEKQKIEEMKADNLEKNLTFIDGVLLTHRIYDNVLKKQLTDKNGEPEKDNNGCDYLGAIDDDINDLLFCKTLENGYYKNRGSQLFNQFELDL